MSRLLVVPGRLLASGAVTALILGALNACSQSQPSPPSAQPTCETAEERAALIAERLTGGATELRHAQAVRLDPPVGQYDYVVAGRVQDEIGVWAVGPWLGGARIMSLDPVARRWSDWGSAIPDDSAAGKQRKELASRLEVAAARACVAPARELPGPSRRVVPPPP